MSRPISPREWETLSAYLDGQLSRSAQARLEQRLNQDAELRQALEELRQTRFLLRSQPKLRAPRNFTLTPTMAGLSVRGGRGVASGPYPMLRLASALAMLFFLVITIGDFALQRLGTPMTAMVVPQKEVLAPEGMGGGEVVEEPVAAARPEGVEETMAVLESPSQEETPSEEFRVLVATPVAKPLVPMDTEQAGEALPGAPALVEPGRGGEMGPPVVEEPATVRVFPWRSLIRFVQIALALLAVASGWAAFSLRRGR